MSSRTNTARVLPHPSLTPPSLSPPSLPLPDGGSISVEDGAAAIRDAEGRLLVRFKDGAAEIFAPAGDLTLAAPAGRVRLRAGRAVELHVGDAGDAADARDAGQDSAPPQLRVDAATTSLDTPRLDIRTDAARLTAGEASLVARRVATTATEVVHAVERLEINATRLVERTRDTFREAAGLLQTKAGRARTLIDDAYALWSRRTTLASREETSIDGSKVLLG
ncbi:MAG TPA: DUF3540 domain-containing protein [Candidatus Nanopelagicales bacterium]|nr:DUF3540 domain-containing protein [Candidatus Nanopelagicales bacterium]